MRLRQSWLYIMLNELRIVCEIQMHIAVIITMLLGPGKAMPYPQDGICDVTLMASMYFNKGMPCVHK